MTLKPDPLDELLDEAVSRLKSLPVPDYPRPPQLDLRRPDHESRPRAIGRRSGAGVLVVVCAVMLLAVIGVLLPTRQDPVLPGGLTNVVQRPVQVQTIALNDQFRSLDRELDAVSLRLNEIEDEIVTQELLAESRSLLARYSPSESETW